MPFRDRVRELRRVPARELRPNPRNWRRHPPRQRAALAAVLTEVGYADALLARELSDGSLELIDGHLRAETTPDQEVPVLVLDVSAAEADKLLAVIDPLAAMAEPDSERLADLLASVQSSHESLRKMWSDLSPAVDAAAVKDRRSRRELPSVAVPESYQLLVDCRDETDQRRLFERLHAEGYSCRVLTL